MTLKNDIRRGFILPTVLLFLTGLGALAVAFALGLASEGQLSENLKRSDQEKLILLSAVEHVKALFLAAEINYPGSWLREGRSGPYVIGGLRYSLKITPLSDNFAYQEFWSGGWQKQAAAALSPPRETLAKLKLENKDEKDRALLELALILSDASDENHALQEHAGVYGAEAVSFSEILSDDGSELRFAYRANAVYNERAVTSLPYFYGARDYDSNAPVTETIRREGSSSTQRSRDTS